MTGPQSAEESIGAETTHHHLIPVNRAKEQIVLPIAREYLETDEITIYPLGDVDETDGIEELTNILKRMLGHDTTVAETLETPQNAYTVAYEELCDRLQREDKNSVWVNVSGATGAWSIAFSQAATTLQMQYPDRRPDITIYTVTDGGEPNVVGSAPHGTPTEVGKTILKSLFNGQTPASIAELARRLCDGELDGTFKSKIQYNVKKLEKQGYIKRVGSHTFRPILTPTGEMWAESHEY